MTILGIQAQTVEDALRYSSLQPQGTARFVATGGSMSALGVDFSTFSVNPAGIGWVRNGYVVVTPGFKLENSKAQLLDGTGNSVTSSNKGNLTIPNVGLVFSSQTRSLNWPTFNIGIGLNRLADFNETIKFRGRSVGSILETFVEDANDNIFNSYRNNLALEVNAILRENNNSPYVSDYDAFNFVNDGTILREGIVTRTGGMSEFILSFGGSFKDKVMWGATFGVPSVNFKETREYDEIDRDAEVAYFDDLSFDEELDVSGNGINFKFGLIFRPTQALRLSVATHSPTFWSLDEVYETTFVYNYTENGEAKGGTALSPRSEFSYNLQTPWRFILGAATVIGKKGFISADVDYANYASNKFSYDDFTTEATAVNNQIDSLATSGLTIRGGGEYNLGKIQVRAGASLQSVPFEGIDKNNLTLSGGLGYRSGRFFVDMAYQYQKRDLIFQPYSTFRVAPQQVDVDLTRHNLLLSGGLYF